MNRTKMFVTLLGCCLAVSMPTPAQVITGTILGTVTDSSNSVVPDAKVSLQNTGTNIVTRIGTNTHGEYVAPLLPPGIYDVTIEAVGFKTFKKFNVNVTLDEKVRVD